MVEDLSPRFEYKLLNCSSIIFSFWTSTLNVVEVTLEQSQFPFTRVDGAMPQKQRQAAIKAFREEPRIRAILISLRCGATGLVDCLSKIVIQRLII